MTYDGGGAVATLAIDDGKVNALSAAVLEALLAGLDRAESEEAAVLLTGRPGYFTAGFDLKVFEQGGDELLRMLELGAVLSGRILAFPRPVVIAASGHALAAGAFLLLAADLRIGAAGPFRVGLNEVQIGLTMPWFVVELARHRLNPRYLDAAVVHATIYTPEDAIAPGYLDRTAAPDRLADESRAAAEELAALNARAFAETKQRLRGPAIAAVQAGAERMLDELRAAMAG